MSKLTCQIEAHNSTSATFYGSTEFGNFQFCTWTYSPSHSRLAESCNHYHGNRDERNRWEIGVFGLKEIGKREIRKRIKIIYWIKTTDFQTLAINCAWQENQLKYLCVQCLIDWRSVQGLIDYWFKNNQLSDIQNWLHTKKRYLALMIINYFGQ